MNASLEPPPPRKARQPLSRAAELAIAGLLLLIAVVLMTQFFERLPTEGTSLAQDWNGLWLGLEGGRPQYDTATNATGLRVVPWVVVLLLPLGWLSMRSGWGVLSLVTLAVLAASVPAASSRRMRWLGIALLTASYLSLRQLADGNFEFIIIAGVLLCVRGYSKRHAPSLAAGVLLASAKPQETWLLLLVLGVYVLRSWPTAEWLKALGLIALVAVPCLLWLGPAWAGSLVSLEERGSIVDSSLAAAFTRLGWPNALLLVGWAAVAATTLLAVGRTHPNFTREQAGLLVVVSLLLAPYATANSYLTVLAIAVIPLMLARQPIGWLLFGLSNLPIFARAEVLFHWSAYYWTVIFLLTWALLALRLGYRSSSPQPQLIPGNA